MNCIILADENIPFLPYALRNAGRVILFNGRELNNRQLTESGCNILFVRSTTKVDKELLSGTNVEFVASATSGIDHIDTEYLSRKGIAFYSADGSNSNSVAEYVVYSILKWAVTTKANLPGKAIGIIGYGNIGKLVSKYSGMLGLQILVNDPPLKDAGYKFPANVYYGELNELLKEADIITNHVPLTTAGLYKTSRLLDEIQLNLIKGNSLFIHSSRGGVVNEAALTVLLSKGVTLVMDVWENEPGINIEPAKSCMLATPHIAGYSRDGKIRGSAKMSRAFREFTGIIPDNTIIDTEIGKYSPLGNEYYNNPEELLLLLEKNRQFSSDHLNFISTFDKESKERAISFDKLRKEYPEMRETL